ncbi:MAG: hypothetical protein ACWGNV_10275 [Bacteroidales bacterium]
MKKIFTILLLLQVLEAGATHWLTYYVYVETEYAQGPWSRTRILGQSDYRYLAAREYTDLFGTEPVDLVQKMLQRLGENRPGDYHWKYELELKEDTVQFITDRLPEAWGSVRNELTATMILNGFRAVEFTTPDTTIVGTLGDLTLPYFDLVPPKRNRAGPEAGMGHGEPASPVVVSPDTVQNKEEAAARNPLAAWLVFSILLNLILGISLILKFRK